MYHSQFYGTQEEHVRNIMNLILKIVFYFTGMMTNRPLSSPRLPNRHIGTQRQRSVLVLALPERPRIPLPCFS